jgi:hypothetical protein
MLELILNGFSGRTLQLPSLQQEKGVPRCEASS